MADKIQVHDSLAGLELEGKPEPYRLGVKGGYITFPDPADMDFETGEKFLQDLMNADSIESIFEPWLSESDWKKFRDSRPTLGQIKVLNGRLMEHYRYILGDQGEDSASATI